jgi:CRP/FNR family cyclic AMP-dependent transcriptional regulator
LDEPVLTPRERAALDAGRWFSSLSTTLRHDIYRLGRVRRFTDGQLMSARGDVAIHWSGVARGAVRVSGTSEAGRQATLTYVHKGAWIGDTGIFGSGRRTHDAHAQGDTTLLSVARTDLRELLATHSELYDALLHLNASRLAAMFRQVEDLSTLPLRSRLAKHLRSLALHHGLRAPAGSGEVQIGLKLAQQDLARLVGASRQRVNMELKAMERDQVISIRPATLVVRDQAALSRMLDN